MLSVRASVRASVRDIMLQKALEESQRVPEDLRVFREGIRGKEDQRNLREGLKEGL